MKAQIIDGKIVAIGENIIKTKDNNVYEVDITELPLTEDGETDYEKIFNSSFKIENDKLFLLLYEKTDTHLNLDPTLTVSVPKVPLSIENKLNHKMI